MPPSRNIPGVIAVSVLFKMSFEPGISLGEFKCMSADEVTAYNRSIGGASTKGLLFVMSGIVQSGESAAATRRFACGDVYGGLHAHRLYDLHKGFGGDRRDFSGHSAHAKPCGCSC